MQPRSMFDGDQALGPSLQFTGGGTGAGQVAGPLPPTPEADADSPQNPTFPPSDSIQADVKADGTVTALDALLIANGINNNQTIEQAPHLDVENDLSITVADFDLAIATVQTHLNAAMAAPSGCRKDPGGLWFALCAMTNAKKIHFNFQGVSWLKFDGFATSPKRNAWPLGSGDEWTNHELYEILKDPEKLKKTVFYADDSGFIPWGWEYAAK